MPRYEPLLKVHAAGAVMICMALASCEAGSVQAGTLRLLSMAREGDDVVQVA